MSFLISFLNSFKVSTSKVSMSLLPPYRSYLLKVLTKVSTTKSLF